MDGWKSLKHIAKNQKQLARAINQSKIRQVRRSGVYQFGFLIPKDYQQALQLEEQSGNSKWYDATKLEMDQINEYKVFQDHGKAKIGPKLRKVSNVPEGYQKIRVHLIFAVKHVVGILSKAQGHAFYVISHDLDKKLKRKSI